MKKKFTFHWGHGLILALLSFMIFIVSFLVRFQTQKGNSMDLVTEDYYNYGLQYENLYQAQQNAKQLKKSPSVVVEDNTLVVGFPEIIEPTKGEIKIYRPSNKALDKSLPLRLNDNEMRINEKAFSTGKYDIWISWEDQEGTPFLIKQDIIWK